jgi:hypothetical protein
MHEKEADGNELDLEDLEFECLSVESQNQLEWDYGYLELTDNSLNETRGISDKEIPLAADNSIEQPVKESTVEEAKGRQKYEEITYTEEDSTESQISDTKETHLKYGISWFQTNSAEFSTKMGWSQPIVDKKPDIKAAPEQLIEINAEEADQRQISEENTLLEEDSTWSQTNSDERTHQMSGTAFVAIVGFVLIYVVIGVTIIGL